MKNYLLSLIVFLLVSCQSEESDLNNSEMRIEISGPMEVFGLKRLINLEVNLIDANSNVVKEIPYDISSLNEEIVESKGGFLVSAGFGKTKVIAQYKNYKDTLDVEVIPDPNQVFYISLEKNTFNAGRVISQLRARVIDNEDVLIKSLLTNEVNWGEYENDHYKLNSDGTLIGLKPGMTDITLSYDSIKSSQKIEIIEVSEAGDYFISAYDGVKLRVKLLLPNSNLKSPGVVMTHGSGPGGVTGYSTASQFLPTNGYATLLYDKRGYGQSEGNDFPPSLSLYNVYFDRLANDQLACLEFLYYHSAIDSTKLGFIGYSQAGWLNPLAASKSSKVKFMVNIVGPTVSLGEEVFYSNLTGEANCGNKTSSQSDEEINLACSQYSGDHYFDPMPILENLNIPGFWVLGSKDYSIPVFKVVEDVDYLNTLGKDYSYNLIDRANHCLRDFESGNQYPHWTTSDGIIPWLDIRLK